MPSDLASTEFAQGDRLTQLASTRESRPCPAAVSSIALPVHSAEAITARYFSVRASSFNCSNLRCTKPGTAASGMAG